MTGKVRKATPWTTIGNSTISPIENTIRAEVALDNYYVVVGFEVNHPKAFVNETHDLAVDYGHDFFYLVKNYVIVTRFSFGPSGLGKVGWFNKGEATKKKDGIRNARPGTPDYPVTETISAFRISLSPGQAKKLEAETKRLRSEVYSGEKEYHAMRE